jgi:uncharacterized protein
VPLGAPNVLLVHSPELIDEARDFGAGLYLCGHTHGGQICLPGSIPIITNAACSRRFIAGPWQDGPMAGYTHRGTGVSCVPVRFNCPGEVVVHTLRC